MPFFIPLMFIGAAVATGVGTYMSYQAAQEQAKSQEEIAKYNASVAAQEAKAKEKRGQLEVDMLQERKERMLASSKASTAKSGILSAGAPLLIDIESAEFNAFDQVTTRYNTEVDVNRSLSEVQLYKFQGESARRAGKLNANAALFSGAGQMASIGYQGYSQGAFGSGGKVGMGNSGLTKSAKFNQSPMRSLS